MISLIHPSRGRPLKSFQAMTSWLGKCADPDKVEFIVSIDSSDAQAAKYYELYDGFVKIFRRDNKSSVQAINAAASLSKGDILIVVSDDTQCPANWDKEILRVTEGKKDWILKTEDGIQKWIITNPIMDRAYFERDGYIYNPAFEHLFCDTYLSCVADIREKRISAPLVFTHEHYSVTGVPPDEVHKKNNATWGEGEKTFVELMKKFSSEEIKRIKDQSMVNWLRQRGVK